jgi:CelD/BcsL family acetyltransferase involved in cellulose biosynthesis
MTGHQPDVALVPVRSPADWDALCSGFPHATAFHRYDFLDCIAPSLHCSFIPLAVSSQGQAVGLAPLLVKKIGPFCTINWVPFPYLGPLVPAELVPATLQALRREARTRRAVNHQQSFAEVADGAGAGGFAAARDRTFVVPLAGRTDKELLAAMHADRRYSIRRAERYGFEVCAADTDDFALMDGWLSGRYADQGRPVMYPAGTCARLFRTLANAPGASFTAARLNGTTSAVVIVFSTARAAFGWQIATDPQHRSMHPADLLIWQVMRRARDEGAIELDLVGAPNEGIARFKSRYGAAERHYTVLRRQALVHRVAVSAVHRRKPRPADGQE